MLARLSKGPRGAILIHGQPATPKRYAHRLVNAERRFRIRQGHTFRMGLAMMKRLLPNRLCSFTYRHCGATWRSGYATVCKTVYPGSIPGVASNNPVILKQRVQQRVACTRDVSLSGLS